MTRRHALCALLLGAAVPSAGLAAPPPAFEEVRKIDVHSHIFDDVPELAEMLDRTHMRIVNVCVRGTDPERLKRMEAMAEQQQARYGKARFPFASTFDLTRRDDPDYADQVERWLGASFDKGALMVKIWKEVGMEIKDRQGRFVLADDALFDPLYAFLTERGKPLLAHLAEPREAWLPLDPQSVHYGYYSKNPEWHLYGRAGFPSHDELIASRDRLLERHPRLTVIGAHLGSLEHDIDEIARRFDRYPNFHVDCSARTADLTRQPPTRCAPSSSATRTASSTGSTRPALPTRCVRTPRRRGGSSSGASRSPTGGTSSTTPARARWSIAGRWCDVSTSRGRSSTSSTTATRRGSSRA